MSKLTLSVNDAVVVRAKRYAKRHGVSVSRMVETYLSAVADSPAASPSTPVLRELRGSLQKASAESYRKHLREKYQ